MSRPTWTQTVKPYDAESFDWATNKAHARNQLNGCPLAASTGDVSMVEVVTIVARPDKRGELEARIVYALAEPPTE